MNMMNDNLNKRNAGRLLLLMMFFFSSLTTMAADYITVVGVVNDEQGEPLIGCTVQMKGSKVATVTDLDGKFKLQVPVGATLQFKYVGFKDKEVKASVKMSVMLSEDSHVLNEVVAVGYGTMKRSDITGSVVSVNSDDLQQTSAATMDQMLQGRAAGLQMMGNSGAAGSSSSIQIRGINSLSSTNEPIYVIDGAIVRSENGTNVYSNPLADLNPNDVESIEVLKDASATAIYGAQAANGVIIVNMKKGKEGAPKVNFKTQLGWETLPKKLDVMNLREYFSWARECREVSGYSISDYLAHPENYGEGTDWQDALFRTGLKQEYNLSVRGGSKNVSYSVSGGYFDQDGIVINNSFSRMSLRASIDVKAYKWLDLGTTISMAQTDRNTGMSTWGVVSSALAQTPNIPVKTPDGEWGKAGYNSETNTYQPNPVAIASITTRLNKISSTRANIYFTLKPWKWLKWRNEGTYDVNTDNYRYLLPAYDLGGTRRDYATHESYKRYNKYTSFKSVATGDWKIAKYHRLSLMLGVDLNSRYVDYLWGQRLGGSDNNASLSGGDATRDQNDGYTTTQRFSSAFSRLSYNYKDRYMLTATVRRDGSSLFARGHRWGTFPSAAMAWRVSEEPFFAPLTRVVSNLKLRLGWGIVGNANLADNTYLPNFSNKESNFGTSYATSNMPNYHGLTWEKTKSWNVGLDFSLFDNRIDLVFDAYVKNIHDLLLQTAQPYFTGTGVTGGASPQWANVGSMRNKGLELTVNARVIKSKKFNWRSSLSYSLSQNEVTGLNVENGFIDKTLDFSQWGGETVTRTAVGHSVSQYYGYQIAGRINSAADFLRNNGDGTSTVIAATPSYRVGTVLSNADATQLKTSIGDFLFKDNNGDGIINTEDMAFLGNGLPKYTFGWNNTFSYKNLSLSVFAYGSVGNKVFNWTRRQLDEPSMLQGSMTNKFTRVSHYAHWAYFDGNSGNKDVWNVYVAPGADDCMPRIDSKHNNYNSRVSDRYVEDASYLRIKNIVLTYSLPKKWIRKFYLQNLNLSFNVQNPFTITGYTGYDPEVGSQNGQYSMSGQGMLMYGVDTGKVPTPRSFVFGLDATF